MLWRVHLVAAGQILHIHHESVQFSRDKRLITDHLLNILRCVIVVALRLACAHATFILDEVGTATAFCFCIRVLSLELLDNL